jgi:phage terminase small subunit
MPPLKNQRQEKFCLEYFKTGNVAASAVTAGYSVKAVRAVSSRMLTFANVKARILELQKKAEDASIMTALERRQRLSEIGRGNLIDFIGSDGDPLPLNRDIPNNRALTEYSIITTTTKSGNIMTTRSVKLHNPVAAIQELNRMTGDYAPTKIEATGKDGAPLIPEINILLTKVIQVLLQIPGITDEQKKLFVDGIHQQLKEVVPNLIEGERG